MSAVLIVREGVCVSAFDSAETEVEYCLGVRYCERERCSEVGLALEPVDYVCNVNSFAAVAEGDCLLECGAFKLSCYLERYNSGTVVCDFNLNVILDNCRFYKRVVPYEFP